MKVPNEYFDQIHIEHPHRMQFKRAKRELHLTKKMENALKKGDTVYCSDRHQMVLTKPLTVRPWINWRREFEGLHPEQAKAILEKNRPYKARFVEIS